jgi:hypothetical protein
MNRSSKASVVAIACILLAMPLSGCLDDPEEEDPQEVMTLNIVDIYSMDQDGNKIWNIELDLRHYNITESDWTWEDVNLTVTGPNGTAPVTVFLEPWRGEVGEGIHAYFYDRNDPDNHTAPFPPIRGNDLYVTGLESSYMNGRLTITIRSKERATIPLPDGFAPDGELSFWDQTYRVIVGDEGLTWSIRMKPLAAGFFTYHLYWNTLTMGIVGKDGTFLVERGPIVEHPSYEDFIINTTIHSKVGFFYNELTREMFCGVSTDPYWLMWETMDSYDSIIVRGLSIEHLGCTLVLYKGEDLIWKSEPIGPLQQPDVKVELDDPVIWTKETNDTMSFNASFLLEKVDFDYGKTSLIPWGAVRVVVTDEDSNILANGSVRGLDPGEFCSTFQAYFREDWNRDGNVSDHDYLILKGLDMSYQGTRVEVLVHNKSIGNTTLPEMFNPPDV